MAKKVSAECKLCRQIRPLCDAHLWPKAIKAIISGDHVNFVEWRPDSGSAKISQNIEFDREILCAACDHDLGHYDSALVQAHRDFYNHPSRQETPQPNQPAKYAFVKVDTDRFKKGILASLLRLSFSKRTPHLSLKRHYEEHLRAWFAEGCQADEVGDHVEVKIFGYSKSRDRIEDIMVPEPHTVTFGRSTYFSIYLPAMMIVVKMGPDEWPSSLRTYQITDFCSDMLEIPVLDPEHGPPAGLVDKILDS